MSAPADGGASVPSAAAGPRAAAEATPVLRTRGLSCHFGELRANDGVDLDIVRGSRHALIGPNGAGKTTLINLLSGRLAPSAGRIELDGLPITDLPEHLRVRRGLARTFQINALFPGLTVRESILLAVLEHQGLAARWWRPVGAYRAQRAVADELLERLDLSADADRVTHALPSGRQRLLEIGLALATGPQVLLLDEPAAGLPTASGRGLYEALERLPAGLTIVLIEHDMDLVFAFAQTITVLVGGQVLREGSPAQIAADPAVRAVYLGPTSVGADRPGDGLGLR